MTPTKVEAWRQRKAEIIERYGSADAASAPCERERLLLAAVAPWRKASEGWTLDLDGWRGSGLLYRDVPPRAIRAIREAYPLPRSFSEAKAEVDYWDERNAELRDVLSDDGTYVDDIALDLVAEVRAAIVRDLALYGLPVSTVGQLHARCTMYQEAGIDDPRFDQALYRDIAAMAEASKGRPSATGTDAASQIGTALSADPSRSNRDVARSLGCSPTTVGRIRSAMGLQAGTRSVSRGGQRFEMRLAETDT